MVAGPLRGLLLPLARPHLLQLRAPLLDHRDELVLVGDGHERSSGNKIIARSAGDAARKAGLANANSTEFDPETKDNVVYIMEGQAGKESTGGTLRLGDYTAKLQKKSKIASLYNSDVVTERHRHRYEVNQMFMQQINDGGLTISGTSPDGKLVEFVEADASRYFVATQAHPEFRSRPMRPHPLFVGLIQASKH